MKNYIILSVSIGILFSNYLNAQSNDFRINIMGNHSILGDFMDLRTQFYQSSLTYQVDRFTEISLAIGLLRDKQAYHPYDYQRLPHHIYLVPLDLSLLLVPMNVKGFSIHLGGGFSLRHRNSELVLAASQSYPGSGEPDPIKILNTDEYEGWDTGYNIITCLQYQPFDHWSVSAQMFLQSYDKGTGVASFGGGIGYHF
ncbi:MAG: hypothetical protein ACOC0C_07480 [Bacteroidota bacterium]